MSIWSIILNISYHLQRLPDKPEIHSSDVGWELLRSTTLAELEEKNKLAELGEKARPAESSEGSSNDATLGHSAYLRDKVMT